MTLPTLATVPLLAVLDALPFVGSKSDAPSDQLHRVREAIEQKKARARWVEGELERLQAEGVEAVLAGEEGGGESRARRAELREELGDLRAAVENLERAEDELAEPVLEEQMHEALAEHRREMAEARRRLKVLQSKMRELLEAYAGRDGFAVRQERAMKAGRRYGKLRHRLEHEHGRGHDELPERLSGVDAELVADLERWENQLLRRLPRIVDAYHEQ